MTWTAKECYAEWETCRKDFAPLYTAFGKADAMYNFDHYNSELFGWPTRKTGEERYQSPIPNVTVDTAASKFLAQELRVNVMPLKETTTQAKLDDLEKFVLGLLYVNNLREQEWSEMMTLKDAVGRGLGVLFAGWDSDYEEMDELSPDEYGEIPYVIRSRSPYGFCWTKGDKRAMKKCFYSTESTASDVMEEWGMNALYVNGKDGSRKADRDEKVWCLDVWWWGKYPEEKTEENRLYFDAERAGKPLVFHAVCAALTWCLPPVGMPNYKNLPYYVFAGNQSHTREEIYVGDAYPSFLRAQMEAVQERNMILSRIGGHVKANSDAYIIAPESMVIDKTPGSIWRRPPGAVPGEDPKYLDPPRLPMETMPLLGMIDRDMQSAGFGDTVLGVGGGAISDSSRSMQFAATNDLSRLQITSRAFQLVMTRMIQDAMYCIGHYAADRSVTVFTRDRAKATLKGRDLLGWRVDISFDIESEQEKKGALALMATIHAQWPELPDTWLLSEVAGVDQTTEIAFQMMVQAFMKDPLVDHIARRSAVQAVHPELMDDPMIVSFLTGQPLQMPAQPPGPPPGPPQAGEGMNPMVAPPQMMQNEGMEAMTRDQNFAQTMAQGGPPGGQA